MEVLLDFSETVLGGSSEGLFEFVVLRDSGGSRWYFWSFRGHFLVTLGVIRCYGVLRETFDLLSKLYRFARNWELLGGLLGTLRVLMVPNSEARLEPALGILNLSLQYSGNLIPKQKISAECVWGNPTIC